MTLKLLPTHCHRTSEYEPMLVFKIMINAEENSKIHGKNPLPQMNFQTGQLAYLNLYMIICTLQYVFHPFTWATTQLFQ